MPTYSMPPSKRLKAFSMLEAYILQQRKKRIEIYTNDPVMKDLIERAYPNLSIGLLQISIEQSHKEDKESK